MVRPSFASVRKHYPTSRTHSCSMTFPNTCAIRMSEALVAASPRLLDAFKRSGKNRCPHDFVRGAQDLAAILASPTVFGTRDHGWEKPGTAPKKIEGLTGIICFMNIPSFGGQGHIDLWDRNGPIGAAYWDASPVWMWELQ